MLINVIYCKILYIYYIYIIYIYIYIYLGYKLAEIAKRNQETK